MSPPPDPAAIAQFFAEMDTILNKSLQFEIGTIFQIVSVTLQFLYFFKFLRLAIQLPRPVYILIVFTPFFWFCSAVTQLILWTVRPSLTDLQCLIVNRFAVTAYLLGKTIIDTVFLTRVKAFYGTKSFAFIVTLILYIFEDFGVQIHNVFTVNSVRNGWFICLPDTPPLDTLLHLTGTLSLTIFLQVVFLYRIFMTYKQMVGLKSRLHKLYQSLLSENLQYATLVIATEIIGFLAVAIWQKEYIFQGLASVEIVLTYLMIESFLRAFKKNRNSVNTSDLFSKSVSADPSSS